MLRRALTALAAVLAPVILIASVHSPAAKVGDSLSPVHVPDQPSYTLDGIGPVVLWARAVEANAEAARTAAARDSAPARTTSSTRSTTGLRAVNWDAIAQCETGGNWQMVGPRYSGGVGFANTTWNGFGGREFAAMAGYATREQQIIVAERVYARYGLSGWGCRAAG